MNPEVFNYTEAKTKYTLSVVKLMENGPITLDKVHCSLDDTETFRVVYKAKSSIGGSDYEVTRYFKSMDGKDGALQYWQKLTRDKRLWETV